MVQPTACFARKLRDSVAGFTLALARPGFLARGVVVALLGAYAAGWPTPVVEAGQDTSEGEAVLAALDHVAAIKWEERGLTLVKGRAAVAYREETPLSESTRSLLDEALEARGWRWSTEDPLVPTGNCIFPSGDCRLKDPTELHLTFSVKPWPGEEDYEGKRSDGVPWDDFVVEPVAGEEGYKVHVTWLGSLRWRDGHHAELGGEGVLVTRGTEGWVAEVRMSWIT